MIDIYCLCSVQQYPIKYTYLLISKLVHFSTDINIFEFLYDICILSNYPEASQDRWFCISMCHLIAFTISKQLNTMNLVHSNTSYGIQWNHSLIIIFNDKDNNDLISIPVWEQMAHWKWTFEESLIKGLF